MYLLLEVECMYLKCTECGTLDFDARFALHYTGQSCCVPVVEEPEIPRVQLEFCDSSGQFGKWCRSGICSIEERPCQCRSVYHWHLVRKYRKRS